LQVSGVTDNSLSSSTISISQFEIVLRTPTLRAGSRFRKSKFFRVLFQIRNPNCLRLAVSPRPRVVPLCLVPSSWCLVPSFFCPLRAETLCPMPHALCAALIDTIVGLMIALFSFSRGRLRDTFWHLALFAYRLFSSEPKAQRLGRTGSSQPLLFSGEIGTSCRKCYSERIPRSLLRG
jgi:hypothetical protein